VRVITWSLVQKTLQSLLKQHEVIGFRRERVKYSQSNCISLLLLLCVGTFCSERCKHELTWLFVWGYYHNCFSSLENSWNDFLMKYESVHICSVCDWSSLLDWRWRVWLYLWRWIPNSGYRWVFVSLCIMLLQEVE